MGGLCSRRVVGILGSRFPIFRVLGFGGFLGAEAFRFLGCWVEDPGSVQSQWPTPVMEPWVSVMPYPLPPSKKGKVAQDPKQHPILGPEKPQTPNLKPPMKPEAAHPRWRDPMSVQAPFFFF